MKGASLTLKNAKSSEINSSLAIIKSNSDYVRIVEELNSVGTPDDGQSVLEFSVIGIQSIQI